MEKNTLNVLSLFDGMSCGQIALERAGIKVDNYFASEIDKYAIKITQKNYPNTIQLGDVTKWQEWKLPKIDLIIGGSPCQGFSFAGDQLGFEDPRSKLFFIFEDIVKFYKPKHFLLENVKMKREYLDIISARIGFEPIFINSDLVSAQSRSRYYWTNIPGVILPEDKEIFLASILQSGEVDRNKSYCIDANYWKGGNPKIYKTKSRRQILFERRGKEEQFVDRDKSYALCSSTAHNPSNYFDRSRGQIVFKSNGEELYWRKLTPIECERLQTVPDNYTEGVSNTQRYRMLGNGWTVDVIAHIFSFMEKK